MKQASLKKTILAVLALNFVALAIAVYFHDSGLQAGESSFTAIVAAGSSGLLPIFLLGLLLTGASLYFRLNQPNEGFRKSVGLAMFAVTFALLNSKHLNPYLVLGLACTFLITIDVFLFWRKRKQRTAQR